MTDDPMNDIEQRKGTLDLGRTGYLIMRGAIDEGATPIEAIMIVAAFFEGTARGGREDNESDPDV